MATYETEEQQMEAIRTWWRNNGKSLIAGLVAGLAVILGWQGWQQYRDNHGATASGAYQAFIASERGGDAFIAQGQHIIEAYADLPYAALAALLLASDASERGDLDASERQLRWVIDHADTEAIVRLAELRLAELHIAAGKPDQALALLGDAAPQGFEALYAELRGDALAQQGDRAGAAQAYEQALTRAQAGNRQWLQLKRDDLGV